MLTWCCIACVFFSRYFGHPEYLGETNDLAGSTFSARLDPALFDQKAISEMPTWHAADANPPLSARAALKIADQFRQNQLQNIHNFGWGLDSVSLCPLDGRNGKWCWLVEFTAWPEKQNLTLSGPIPQVFVYVLMDGRIIEPENEMVDFWKESGMLKKDPSEKISETD